MPSFFLSSAVGDDDQYVRQLFDDLLTRVGDSGATLSYLGTIGNRDLTAPPEMLLRLSTCDVFVALTSPRYFRTEACGRQWQAFADRGRPAAMIPVAWAAGGDVPDPVGTPLAPPGRSLRQLARLRSLRHEYDAFADQLAARIVRAGRETPAPAGEPPDFAAVPDAFARSSSDPRVHFVIAAASREEMDSVRSDLAYYGSEALDWSPYLPSAPQTIAARARLRAADQELRAEVTTLAEVLPLLETARREHEIVVILCDWWLTQLDDYQRLLAQIDRRGLGGSAVLVPASRTDEETMSNLAELRYGLRATFRHGAVHGELSGADAFDSDLAAVLEEARNRLLRQSGPALPDDDPPGRRPILRGPW